MTIPDRSPMAEPFSISEVNQHDVCMQVAFRRDVVGSLTNLFGSSSGHQYASGLALLVTHLHLVGNHLHGAGDGLPSSVFDEIPDFAQIDEVNVGEGWVTITFYGVDVVTAIGSVAKKCGDTSKYFSALRAFGWNASTAAEYLNHEIVIDKLGEIAELVVDSVGKEYEIRDIA